MNTGQSKSPGNVQGIIVISLRLRVTAKIEKERVVSKQG